jgi:hypothetical protein
MSDILLLKKEWILTCQNCGHDCHCGGSCMQDLHDGDMKPVTIECCKHCRHKDEN